MTEGYQGKEQEYPADTPMCWLYEHCAQNGTVYLTGRMGLARVVVLKTTKKSDDNKSLWIFKVRPKRDDEEQAKDGTSQSGARAEKPRSNAYAIATAKQDLQAPLASTPKEPAMANVEFD